MAARKGQTRASASARGPSEALGQLVAIGQSGQGIVISQVFDTLLGRAQMPDIARDGREKLDIAAIVTMRYQHLGGQHLFSAERQKSGFIGPHAFLDRSRNPLAQDFPGVDR